MKSLSQVVNENLDIIKTLKRGDMYVLQSKDFKDIKKTVRYVGYHEKNGAKYHKFFDTIKRQTMNLSISQFDDYEWEQLNKI